MKNIYLILTILVLIFVITGVSFAQKYETTFDGSKYSSGIYFYRLTAGNYSETKRMTLIK